MTRLLAYYGATVDAATRTWSGHPVRASTRRRPRPDSTAPTRRKAWIDTERARLIELIAYAADAGISDTAWRLADALRGYFSVRRFSADWVQVAARA